MPNENATSLAFLTIEALLINDTPQPPLILIAILDNVVFSMLQRQGRDACVQEGQALHNLSV